MQRSTIGVATLLLAVSAASAQAQRPFALELRGGAAFPTEDFGPATLKTGGGFGGTLNYLIVPHTGFYVGWDWHRMVTDRALAGNDYDVESTGYAFGLQFRHPIAEPFGIWLRGGGLYTHIELENNAGDIVDDSGHELGWEIGGGATLALSDRWILTPGVRYRSFSADVTPGQQPIAVDLSFVTAEIGLAWTFGRPKTVAARTR